MSTSDPVEIHLGLGHHIDEPLAEDDEVPLWSGGHVDRDGFFVDEGPEFADASEAVQWWRMQGAKRIVITFGSFVDDDAEQFWAGTEPPPVDPKTGRAMSLFSEDDPRGRPEGARATRLADLKRFEESFRASLADKPRREGEWFRDRRASVKLSVETVAERAGVDPLWLADVEGGLVAQITLRQWVDLVWAIDADWPHPPTIPMAGPGWGWLPGDGGPTSAEWVIRRYLGRRPGAQPPVGDR